MKLQEEIIRIEEYLGCWYGRLPFQALEQIFGVTMFGLDEEETEEAINECSDQWHEMSFTEKVETHDTFYDQYSEFTNDIGIILVIHEK